MAAEQSSPVESAPLLDDGNTTRSSGVRWTILALIFFGTAINYIDRQVLSVLSPHLKARGIFTDVSYGYIQGAFTIAYALGQLGSGRWLDWIGTRIGYAIALAAWSMSSVVHALARGAIGFGAARMMLGVSESPNYPTAVKVLADWFPRRERALGMGFVNAGTLIGAVVAPPMVTLFTARFGWQSVFVFTGLLGFAWLATWLWLYWKPQEHPRVSPAELAYIHSDPPDTTSKVRWRTLLTYPQAWAFMIGKFLTDPLWWFYMSWIPPFLNAHYGLDLNQSRLPLIAVYSISVIGSIFGGWLSSFLLKSGASVNMARKVAMLVSGLIVVPIIFAGSVHSVWSAVILLGLATAGHQGFSSNLYTLVSDMFPKQACGSVAGLGGCFGYVGATIFMALTGLIVGRWTHQNYTILFVIAGVGYLVAFLVIQILSPRLVPARIESSNDGPAAVAE